MPGALIFGTLSYFFASKIHKHQGVIYALTLGLAILGFIFEIEPLIEGELAIGIWLLVMFAGALNPKWKLTKQLRLIRKELSIIGFYLISVHGIHFFLAGDLEWFGIAALVLMLPLTIISYGFIRKKMQAKTWKNIQRTAYLIYALIYLHMIWLEAYIYVPIGLIYLGLKLYPLLVKKFQVKQKPAML